jgi:SOS-response transcriptional repressor LexA
MVVGQTCCCSQQKLKNSTEEFYKGYTFSPKINAYNFEMNFNERQEVYKHIKMKKQKEYILIYLESKTKRKIQLTLKLNKDYLHLKYYQIIIQKM